jgi:hypothetical protein
MPPSTRPQSVVHVELETLDTVVRLAIRDDGATAPTTPGGPG